MGLDLIAAPLGETTLAMTQRYAHLGRDDLRAAMSQLVPQQGPGACPRWVLVNATDGHPLYYLIHAGPNETGVKIAGDVLRAGTPITGARRTLSKKS